jgi:hypothetical protein
MLFLESERVFDLGMLTVRTSFCELVSFEIKLSRDPLPFEVSFETDFEKPTERFVVTFV